MKTQIIKSEITFSGWLGIIVTAIGIVLLSAMLAAAQNTFPASGAVGVGTIAPNASSMLDMTSTSKGLLIPRMTKAQRDAIVSPATGLLIYQVNNASGFYYFNGTTWIPVGRGANKDLSNLNTTSINVDLLPNSNNTLNLGSSTSAWKDVYASGSYFIGSSKVLDITGSNNTFLGVTSNVSNTGVYNTFVGYGVGAINTAGSYNTSMGTVSFHNNTIGNSNSAYGAGSMRDNSEGSYNAAIGVNSLLHNTTGIQNTASGFQSLFYNMTGMNNTASGAYALQSDSIGSSNTASGVMALLQNKTGSNNTADGLDALYYNVSGNNNTGLGFLAGVNAGGLNNTTAVGNGATTSASDQVRIGNSSVTSIGGFTDWTNVSDGRVKTNIRDNVPGLDFINKLQPVTYNLNLDAIDNIIHSNPSLNTSDNSDRTAKEKIIYSGFIAQDVEQAAKELGYDFSGVDAAKNDHDLYGLRYSQFVVPLVKAVQELSEQNKKLQQEIDELKSGSSAPTQGKSNSTIELSDARLEQNFPNPFNGTTSIRCYVPSSTRDAVIVISTLDGKELKSFTLTNSGMNEITIDAATLTSGDYLYQLVVGGKVIDSKKMELTK